MIQARITRPPADRPGQDISDALLTALAPILARGAAEINAGAPRRRYSLTLTCGWLAWIQPGTLVAVEVPELPDDTDTVAPMTAVVRVTGFVRNHDIDGDDYTSTTTITCELLGVDA